MFCSNCGSPIEASAPFCGRCGSPAPEAGRPAPHAPAGPAIEPGRPPGIITFTFTASPLGYFFRTLGAGLASAFLIPAPWIACWYSRWFLSEIRLGDGTNPHFRGTPGSVALLVILYFVVMLLANASAWQEDLIWIDLLAQLGAIVLSWAFFRWLVDHTELGGGLMRFEGSVWGYIGWMLLTYLSILTIIGWAWVSAAFYRWGARNSKPTEGRLQFVAKGHQILWRVLVFVLFSIPIVTIPWSITWYMRWVVSQVEWDRGAPQPAMA